jgi:hypothetical protein
VPRKDGVVAGFCADPEVPLLGFAVAGREVFDDCLLRFAHPSGSLRLAISQARFVHLHVAAVGLLAAREHVVVDRFVNMHQQVRGEAHPLRERLQLRLLRR